MNKIEIKRLNIAINYFTNRYFEVYKKPATFDKVQKFLFFVDLESVKTRGKPAFGLEYIVLNGKIVPKGLYITKYDKRVDLSYFAKAEIEIIDNVINNLNKLSYDKTLKDGSIINFANEIEDEYLKEVFEGYKTIKELGRCR